MFFQIAYPSSPARRQRVRYGEFLRGILNWEKEGERTKNKRMSMLSNFEL